MKDILCRKGRWRYLFGKIIGPGLSIGLFVYVYLKVYCSLFNNVIKGPICPLIWGFILAAIRSLVRDCLIYKNEKSIGEMLWPYLINYPLILTLVYIIGSYFLAGVKLPYISSTIFFGLGFFIDEIFRSPLDFLKK